MLRLEDQLCFALYAASRAMTRTYRDELAEIGLTFPQYVVLLVLWQRDGLTVSEIGDRVRLDSGTLTPLLKRLEAGGVVRRERSTADGREVHITLTTAGQELKAAACAVRAEVVRRLAISEDEYATLMSGVQTVIANLEASFPVRVGRA